MKYAFKEIKSVLESEAIKDILSKALTIKHNKALLGLWKKAEHYCEFVSMIDNDEDLKYHEDVVFLRKDDWHYKQRYCRELGTVFGTYSDFDFGSLRIGNEHFSMLFSNGLGYGLSRVAILPCSKHRDVKILFPQFLGVIEGSDLRIGLRSWETGQRIDDYCLGEGKFWVYGDDRFFAIVKETVSGFPLE